MAKLCVVVSGLPASGKTTAARALASGLGLSLFDKDDILESFFDQYGVGDAQWRQKLSRASDIEFQRHLLRSDSSVVVSHWRASGGQSTSGTPTEWLQQHFSSVVQVHCKCAPQLAAQRFMSRTRHLGHLDNLRSYTTTLDWMQSLAGQPQLQMANRVEVEGFDQRVLQALLIHIQKIQAP